MQQSNLILGYTIKRDVLEQMGGARLALPTIDERSLIVFPHDMKAFAIPYEHVADLAEVYQRYLISSRILDCSALLDGNLDCDLQTHDEEVLHYDHTSLLLIHETLKVPFKDKAFNLDAAISFVEQEANLSKILAIRWCMMMEYISFEDQRCDVLRDQETQNDNILEAADD